MRASLPIVQRAPVTYRPRAYEQQCGMPFEIFFRDPRCPLSAALVSLSIAPTKISDLPFIRSTAISNNHNISLLDWFHCPDLIRRVHLKNAYIIADSEFTNATRVLEDGVGRFAEGTVLPSLRAANFFL